jgi:hypothetical protein
LARAAEGDAAAAALSATDRGLILGIGGASRPARRLAAAKGRTLVTVPGLTDAWPVLAAMGNHSSVLVVMPRRDCTFETANSLVEAGCRLDRPIGVLPLDMAAGDASRTRLPLPPEPSPPYPHRVALYCDFLEPPPRRATPASPMFGRATSASFIQWLKDGTEAAVLHVHGNGADFRVGTDVLCVQVGSARPAPGRVGERFLPCQAGGRCRLEHKASFRAFHGPSALRSRLVVLLSCSAFQPSDGLLDARFTFVDALLNGPHVEGVVCSTRINFGTPEVGVAVLASLDAGLTLGDVARRINGVSRYGPPSYLCLGDPEGRLEGPASVDSRTVASLLRPAAPRSVAAGAAAQLRTVSYLFSADLLTVSGGDTYADLCDRLRILALTAAGRMDGDEQVDDELARAIAVLSSREPDGTMPLWASLCEDGTSIPEAPTCPHCGTPARQRRVQSRLYRPYRRTVWRCGRHGVLEDLPSPGIDGGAKVARVGRDRFRVDASSARGSVVVARIDAGGGRELRELRGDRRSVVLPPGGRGHVVQVHHGRFAWLALPASGSP